MNRTLLSEYLSRPLDARMSQRELAEKVGVTQGAIHQIIKAGRNVFLIEHDGAVRLEEVRPVPRPKQVSA